MASTASGVGPREATAFRRNKINGRDLTAEERERLLKPYLPDASESSTAPASSTASSRTTRRRSSVKPRRRPSVVRHTLHVIIYTTVSFLFSVFFRFRRSWRLVKSKVVALLKYHHRTPEFIQRDTRHLEKLPKHLSVVLEFEEGDEGQESAGLEGLVNDLGEIAAWTASAGIPYLSVYERTGMYTLTLLWE